MSCPEVTNAYLNLQTPRADDLYSVTTDLSVMASSIQGMFDTPPPRPVLRCTGCHSSEFDMNGKCVYCRQYRTQ